jgi:hypothetical protein
MREAYIRRIPPCQAAGNYGLSGQTQEFRKKPRKNANDHEQQVRVHPALPCYYVVVQAPELGGKASTAPCPDT